MKRGEIWDIQLSWPNDGTSWSEQHLPGLTASRAGPLPFERVQGSEPYGHGPVVVVSSDPFNRSAIQTVIVAVVTSNLKLERAPGNFMVLADETNGLSQDSVVSVSQILVVNKVSLLERCGQLDEVGSALLSLGLRKVFDLP